MRPGSRKWPTPEETRTPERKRRQGSSEGYSWPPFEAGHQLSRKHGFYATKFSPVEQEEADQTAELLRSLLPTYATAFEPLIMSETDIQRLEAKLTELKGERSTVDVTMTKEDLARNVEQWLETARAHAAGSSRLVLGGQASGEHLAAVLHEDLLADEGLSARTIARLERQNFGEVSNRQKTRQLAKLDQQIEAATAELREARKAEALAAVEAEFAGVSGEAA